MTRSLSGSRAELFRNGETRCVEVGRHDEPSLVAEINRLAYQKYHIMQLATAIGIFSDEPNPGQVVLRLHACGEDA